MRLDSFAIGALHDELQAALLGGRVQRVVDIDAMTLGLEVYAGRARHSLLLNADAQAPYVARSQEKLRRGLQQPTQLGLHCRNLLMGARIRAIQQPAWDRILHIQLEAQAGTFYLIAELVPRRANILLTRDGRIVDCLRRVGPLVNRYRLSLPKHIYVPPPPLPQSLDPLQLSIDEAEALLANADEPRQLQLRRLLPRKLLGISPLLAQEIAYRATGNAQATASDCSAEALQAACQDTLAPALQRHWTPGIVLRDGLPLAASALELRHIQWQPQASLSAAILHMRASGDGAASAYEPAKLPVQAALDVALDKLRAKLAALQRDLPDAAQLEALKQAGELILAYQHGIAHGQRELRAAYTVDAPEARITLQPELSPLENAQLYFRRYRKAKAARAGLPQRLRSTQLEIAHLAQLTRDLQQASNWLEIDDVVQALQARNAWLGKPRPPMGGTRAGPRRIVSPDGFVLWIGRNSRQNATLISKIGKAQDIWLHAREVPGAHVLIRYDGRRISDELIAQAAALAAHHSSRSTDRSVPVDYTRLKYVKAIKGAGPGLVRYRNERTIHVQPRADALDG